MAAILLCAKAFMVLSPYPRLRRIVPIEHEDLLVSECSLFQAANHPIMEERQVRAEGTIDHHLAIDHGVWS